MSRRYRSSRSKNTNIIDFKRELINFINDLNSLNMYGVKCDICSLRQLYKGNKYINRTCNTCFYKLINS